MASDLFPAAPIHRLFFALRPDASACAAIGRVAAPLRVVHPQARWIQPARYHATLLYLGESAGLRQDWVDGAHAAAADLPAAPFALTLDHLAALGQPSRPAMALTAAQVPDALRRLHEALRQRCLAAGLRPAAGRALLPHVTIAYTGPKPALPLIDAVLWWPEAFELVQSVEGRAEHDVLGRWPLPPIA